MITLEHVILNSFPQGTTSSEIVNEAELEERKCESFTEKDKLEEIVVVMSFDDQVEARFGSATWHPLIDGLATVARCHGENSAAE